MKPAHILRAHAGQIGWWFGLLAGLAFCGNALAGLAARWAGPDARLVWLGYAVSALATATVGTLAVAQLALIPFRRQGAELDRLRQELAEQSEWQRRLRHDLRGALSPALLTADRLLANADPKVQRAGNIMVQAVERSAALLDKRED